MGLSVLALKSPQNACPPEKSTHEHIANDSAKCKRKNSIIFFFAGKDIAFVHMYEPIFANLRSARAAA